MTKLHTLPTGEAHTLAEWAKITGVHYETIAHRLRQGLPIERAIVPGATTAHVEHDGHSRTFKEWQHITNVPARLIYSRLVNGWNISRALSTPHRNRVIKS